MCNNITYSRMINIHVVNIVIITIIIIYVLWLQIIIYYVNNITYNYAYSYYVPIRY